MFPGNGSVRPLEEHEAFVARSAEEMDRAGQWLIGRFGGEWRLEKPPVNYWLALGAHRLLGGPRVSELEARLPSMVAGVLLAYVAFEIAASVFRDRRAGFAAALLWSTSSGLTIYGRNARPEMVYALCCGLLMLGLVRAAESSAGPRASWAWALFGWAAAALAVLTKGPFLPVLVAVGAHAGAWASRRHPGAARPRPFQSLAGALLVLCVTGAYVLAVVRVLPDAIEFWRHEMFDRVGSESPLWRRPLELYYLYAPISLILPWVFPLACALPWTWKQRSGGVWMLAGAILVTGCALSVSDGRHAYYALPVLPFVHCLMGGWLVDWHDRRQASGSDAVLARGLAIHTGVLVAGALVLIVHAFRQPLAAWIPWAAGPIVAVVLGAAAHAWKNRRARPGPAFAWLVLGFAALEAGAGASCLGWSPDRFTRAAFAREVGSIVPAEAPLVALGGARELVIYYADRPVPRVSPASLREHPGAWVIATAAQLESAPAIGEVVHAERPASGGKSMVLLRPEPAEPSPPESEVSRSVAN